MENNDVARSYKLIYEESYAKVTEIDKNTVSIEYSKDHTVIEKEGGIDEIGIKIGDKEYKIRSGQDFQEMKVSGIQKESENTYIIKSEPK